MVQKQVDMGVFFIIVKKLVDECLDIQNKRAHRNYKRGDVTWEKFIEIHKALSALQFEYPSISYDDDNHNKGIFTEERLGNPIIFYKVVIDAPIFGKQKFILVEMKDKEVLKVMRKGSL